MLKESIQLGVVSDVLRKEGKLGSNHTVKFSCGTWHPVKIRERHGPSQGVVQKCEPHERSPCAPKFGDRALQETVHQERCARRVSLDLAENASKLKNTEKTMFCSPTEAWVMPAPSSKKLEEREFVVDSGASMHMLSNKVLRSAEMETLRRSWIPTTVVTANGEVQANAEAQVQVHDLDLFVTVQFLENTPAVLSLGRHCEDQGSSSERASGEQPRLTLPLSLSLSLPLSSPGVFTQAAEHAPLWTHGVHTCPEQDVKLLSWPSR